MRVCSWNIHVASHSLCVCICMFAQLCRHMWRPTSGGFFTSYFLRQGDSSNSPCPAFMWVNQTQVIGLAAGILPTSLALVFFILLSTDKLCSKVVIRIGISTKFLNVFWYDGRKLGICFWLARKKGCI